LRSREYTLPMAERRHPNVVNLNEVAGETRSKGARFAHLDKTLGPLVGGRTLGCSWYEVPPGCTAFPYHWHSAAEEGLFVLEGAGTLRIGPAEVPLGAGDYVAFPTGPDHAHQLVNTSSAPLRYLALSSQSGNAEVVGYPDSNKIGASSFGPDGKRWIRHLGKLDQGVDYYEGEKID
jgi:uncharacterized cupin superfamily protein